MMKWKWIVVWASLSACTDDGTSTQDSGSTETGAPDVTTTPLTVVGYNVESGDAVDTVVAERIAEVRGEVAWGFSEVYTESWMRTFQAAADDGGQDFQYVFGTSGGSDRLGLLYDANRLELLESLELRDLAEGARAPLVGRFADRETGQELFLMVNHLWRSDARARRLQSQGLNAWAREQTLPIIAVGDYNYDWEVDGGDTDHDVGYDKLTEDGVFQWVRPEELIPTQCNLSYMSVLDFTFVAGEAQQWQGVSEILFPQNVHCQDDSEKSDHRPVLATFQVPAKP